MNAASLNAAELIKSLPKLSPKELLALQAAAGMLLQGEPTAPADPGGTEVPQTDLELVYDQVKAVLRESGVLRCPPIPVLSQTGQLGDLKRGTPVLLDYARQFLRPKDRTEMMRGVNFLVEQVVSRLRQQGVPVGLKTVLQGLRRVNDAVDSQFPGYQSSGLLPMAVGRPKAAHRV